MNMDRIKGYIITKHGRIIGEVDNFDPFSRDGHILMYEEQYGYKPGVLDEEYKVMSKRDIVQDQSLLKSLEETNYQRWRFDNRKFLSGEYDRIRKNMVDFDLFCRSYRQAEKQGNLTEFLSEMFADCFDYFQSSFFIDLKREKERGD